MKLLTSLLAAAALFAADANLPNDPAARAALKATRTGKGWGSDFPGFTADLEVFHGGKAHLAKLTIAADGKVAVGGIDDKDAHDYATGALSSIVVHGMGRDFEKGDGRYGITFGPDDGSPLGRIVKLNGDAFDSSYRVRGTELTQVNRRMGKRHFTIDMLSSTSDSEGRKGPQTFVVNTWTNGTNAWVKSESFKDKTIVVGGFALPLQRYAIVTEPDKAPWVQAITLSNHRLSPKKLVSSRD